MAKQVYNSVKRMQQYVAHKEKEKKQMRMYMRSFRPKLLEMLGNKCVKCGFTDPRALQIDHIKGGGNKQLLAVFRTGTEMYRFYLEKPIRARRELQVLCANCNAIKKHENKEGTLGDVFPQPTVTTVDSVVIEQKEG